MLLKILVLKLFKWIIFIGSSIINPKQLINKNYTKKWFGLSHPVDGGENVESKVYKQTQGQQVRQERDRRKRNRHFLSMIDCTI